MIVIDKLCYNSKLRYVNPGEKFIFSVSTLCLCVASRSVLIACLVFMMNGILTVKIGGIPFFRYCKLLRIPLAFLLLSTITIIVNFSKVPLNAFAIPVAGIYITGSYESLQFGIQLILTALAGVSCLYFLSLHTPMTDILDFLRKIHCPSLIIELMLLIYRFIFVLLEIASAMTISQHSRLGNKDLKTALLSFGALGSMLFIRGMKKSNALYDAMESRCYTGTIHVLEEHLPPNKKEILWIIFAEVTLIVILIIERTTIWTILF